MSQSRQQRRVFEREKDKQGDRLMEEAIAFLIMLPKVTGTRNKKRLYKNYCNAWKNYATVNNKTNEKAHISEKMFPLYMERLYLIGKAADAPEQCKKHRNELKKVIPLTRKIALVFTKGKATQNGI